MNVVTLTTTARRELAHRVSGGLEITLYWDARDDTTSIEVHARATADRIVFPVAADRALDAFRHPFAHLAEQEAA